MLADFSWKWLMGTSEEVKMGDQIEDEEENITDQLKPLYEVHCSLENLKDARGELQTISDSFFSKVYSRDYVFYGGQPKLATDLYTETVNIKRGTDTFIDYLYGVGITGSELLPEETLDEKYSIRLFLFTDYQILRLKGLVEDYRLEIERLKNMIVHLEIICQFEELRRLHTSLHRNAIAFFNYVQLDIYSIKNNINQKKTLLQLNSSIATLLRNNYNFINNYIPNDLYSLRDEGLKEITDPLSLLDKDEIDKIQAKIATHRNLLIDYKKKLTSSRLVDL